MKKKEERALCKARCDIKKREDKVIVRMEMSGVSKDDLSIQVKGDLLMVEGKKKLPSHKGASLVREIRDADYYHEFSIDKTIDPENINAVMEEGILTLTLGMIESEKSRNIAIKANA